MKQILFWTIIALTFALIMGVFSVVPSEYETVALISTACLVIFVARLRFRGVTSYLLRPRGKRIERQLLMIGMALILLSFLWLFSSLIYVGKYNLDFNANFIFLPFVVLLLAGCALFWLPLRNSMMRIMGMGDDDNV
jgi:hypothetical protein